MEISFFEINQKEKAFFSEKLKKHKLKFHKETLNEKNYQLAKDSEIISIFAHSEINSNLLKKLPKIKSIVTRTTGFDHIDLNYCKSKNISVQNAPHYGDNTVAEHAFSLILSLSRKIFPSRQKSKINSKENLQGFDLQNKTIGIIGLGNIGRKVAKIANGFEMKILGFDKKENKELKKDFKIKYCSLNELLKNSDIVTIHLPLNKETEFILNKNNLKYLKSDSYLINTSRGELIDTTELIKLIENKKISGLGLDVLEEEDLLKKRKLKSSEKKLVKENKKLMKYSNVIITPHNAYNSKESEQRRMNITLNNIKNNSLNKIV